MQTLLKHADTAMYQAKKLGRDNCQLYSTALTEQAMNRLELDNSLRVALAHNEFRLLYQPVIELATGRLCAVEALIRWDTRPAACCRRWPSLRWPRRTA